MPLFPVWTRNRKTNSISQLFVWSYYYGPLALFFGRNALPFYKLILKIKDTNVNTYYILFISKFLSTTFSFVLNPSSLHFFFISHFTLARGGHSSVWANFYLKLESNPVLFIQFIRSFLTKKFIKLFGSGWIDSGPVGFWTELLLLFFQKKKVYNFS